MVCKACLVSAAATSGKQAVIDCAIEYTLGKLDLRELKKKQ